MRLNKITLDNIRSYEHQEIEFPKGSTLLSGDIGSGKTSILLAIEFAFFGLQPGQRGSSLLKNGETNGGVKIEFEVDGKYVIIERTLKKAKTISQDYCALTIDDEKIETSVTELKDKVLELLNYPKEFAKKQNLLYKFTVYTPQEEMKQIILQDPATRINTLRHVFGIDKYKRILENASILAVKLREEKRINQALTANLEQDKLEIVEKENELETKHYNLASVEKELFLKTEQRKKIQEEKQEISEKVEERTKFEQEIEKTKITTLHKNDSITSNKKIILSLQEQILELKTLEFEESKIQILEQEIISKKTQLKQLSEKNLEITSKINSLNLKNQENEATKNKISHIDICPTCLQDVDSVYKSNVKNKFDSDTSKNVAEIQELDLEKRQISEQITKLENGISTNETQLQELKFLKIKLQEIQDKQQRLEEVIKINISLEKDIGILNQHLSSLKDSVFNLNKYKPLYEEKKKQLEESLKEEKLAEIRVAELKREIEVFARQIQELKEKVLKLEQTKKKLNYLNELELWLSKKFVPVISFIEKNVMVKLKAEFSKLFQEWFSMLVSENFTVKLSDDFTPIIEQQDYELDYAYLSGGERTAIALAYRLALNQVINSLLGKIKTRDFVILDEPTDGFSDQQLDKMREVLDQLNVSQLIIVSHEQKIEGFVENIIRFKKNNGISQKTNV